MKYDHSKFVRTIYLITALQSVNFTLPIYQIYASNELGFSLYQIASFYSILWITSLVFDFIGGGIADKFGKRKLYAIGHILLLVASVLPFLVIKSYTWFPLLAVIGGVGSALSSNTISAIISNELSKTHPKMFKLINSR